MTWFFLKKNYALYNCYNIIKELYSIKNLLFNSLNNFTSLKYLTDLFNVIIYNLCIYFNFSIFYLFMIFFKKEFYSFMMICYNKIIHFDIYKN